MYVKALCFRKGTTGFEYLLLNMESISNELSNVVFLKEMGNHFGCHIKYKQLDCL